MNKVYALGVMIIDLAANKIKLPRQERLWNLFADFETAEKYVLENTGDFFEYYYNIALIEEVNVIDLKAPPIENYDWHAQREWWYQADHSQLDDNKNPKISKIEKPDCIKHVVNFWCG
jgi:3-methyladenine DNA glycosylase AlkD